MRHRLLAPLTAAPRFHGYSPSISHVGNGDRELSSGNLDAVSVGNGPELVAVVDAYGWFDLRLAD